MDIIALIGTTLIILYIFTEVLKSNNICPYDYSVIYLLAVMFLLLAIFLPNKIRKLDIL